MWTELLDFGIESLNYTSGDCSNSGSKLGTLFANESCSEIWSGGSVDGMLYVWSGIGPGGGGKVVRRFSSNEAGVSNGGITCMVSIELFCGCDHVLVPLEIGIGWLGAYWVGNAG